MTMNRRQLALIHIAPKDRGLTDAHYRSALAQIGGVTSAADLDASGFDALTGYFEWLGFRPMEAKGPSCGTREGMASFAQLELFRNLWAEFTRSTCPGEAELDEWLLSKFKVSALRFLTKAGGQKLITALAAMKRRAA